MSSYEETGILTQEQLQKILPPEERLKKGSIAVIECIQKIPCDPCTYICRFGAIRKKSLTDPPEVDYKKCIGCGECVAICPGLAIFVLNLKYKNEEALVMIPYELIPRPKKGETWDALNREGKMVGKARIVAIRIKDGTAVVTIAVKRHLAMEIRNIGRKLK